MSLLFFSLGHPWPICFLWASSSLLLTLHSHGLLLTSLDFLGPITSFSSLGFMGLPLTPYFLCLHYFWACSGPFSLSGFFKAHIPPQGPFIYFMNLWSIIPVVWAWWLCHLFAKPLLLGFLPSIWILKNDLQQSQSLTYIYHGISHQT